MSDFDDVHTGGSAFPRPTSLFQPERYTPSLLDSSSYSPFPSVSGSRSDPFGLNAYLLHPEDQIWAYISPAAPEPYDVPKESPKAKMGGLKKIKSSAALRKGSPLAQPSVVSSMAVPDRRLERKRSQSMDSTSSAAASAVERDEALSAQKTGSASGKKGLSRIFGRRKSIASLRSVDALLSPPPPLPSTASSSTSDLSTPPLSNRSSLISSENESAASSSSSIYTLRTPQESPSQSTDSLAEAISKAEAGDDGSLRRRGIKGWFGRRSSKMPPASSAESSPSVSPNSSATNLTQPSSSVSVDPPSRICPTPEQLPYAWVGDQLRRASYRKLAQLRRPSPHPLAQQLRRQTSHLPNEVASAFEVGQILYPRSINPRDPSAGLTPAQRGLWCLLGVKLVLDQLDRGSLPSGAMGKRPSLPHTISERKPRGMKDFVSRPPFEDRYHVFYPEDIWSPVSMARPGFGVWDLDFSKYILALADSGDVDNRASWPNLPRPSFLGVEALRSDAEDLVGDALAEQVVVEISEEVAMLGAALVVRSEESPRAASIGSNLSEDSSNTDTASTMVDTPLALDGVNAIPEIKIDFDGAEFTPMVLPALELETAEVKGGSSFRRQKVVVRTWEESDDEEEEDEEEEDVQPLRQSVRSSTSLPQSGMKTSSSAPDIREAVNSHSRRTSQPIPTTSQPISSTAKLNHRRSQFDIAGGSDDDRHQRALHEVAKARERRQALHSGEVDRRAEGELRRKEEAKRRSVMPAAAPIRPQSTGGNRQTSTEDRRQRTKSFAQTTSGSPIDQTRSSGLSQTKRYHSFYEVPSTPSSPSTTPYTRGSSHPSPQQFASHALPQHPGMPHSASMSFVPSHMGYYPQPIHGHAQPMYFPSPPSAYPYGNMAMPMYGMASPQARPHAVMPNSHSVHSLPDQQRRQRQRSSYA